MWFVTVFPLSLKILPILNGPAGPSLWHGSLADSVLSGVVFSNEPHYIETTTGDDSSFDCIFLFVADGCELKPVDLVFILDSSNSINGRDWQRMIDFVRKLVSSFQVCHKESR